LFVHSTNEDSSTLYDVATPQRPPRSKPSRDASLLRDEIVDAVAEKVTKKVAEAIDKATTKTEQKLASQRERLERERERLERERLRIAKREERHERGAEALERLAAHLDALEVWTRHEGAARKPRFSRDEIAAAAVRIADAEGFEALSMRRLAAELGAGTMTVYHYVKTKDELLTLVNDTVMGEMVLADGWDEGLGWREALIEIAECTRTCLQAHPWVFDITDDPPIGPNQVRHFDQSMAALKSLDLTLPERLDLVTVIDEYVFGYCLHERTNLHPDEQHESFYSAGMVDYMEGLLATGDYPELSKLRDEVGLAEALQMADASAGDPERFRRNLDLILDGIEVGLQRRR
jgi:AcrR family transcriptional regulator